MVDLLKKASCECEKFSGVAESKISCRDSFPPPPQFFNSSTSLKIINRVFLSI
jgi:hypothetical protein